MNSELNKSVPVFAVFAQTQDTRAGGLHAQTARHPQHHGQDERTVALCSVSGGGEVGQLLTPSSLSKRVTVCFSLLCVLLIVAADEPITKFPADKKQAVTSVPVAHATPRQLVQRHGSVLRLSLSNGRTVDLIDVNLDPKESNVDQVVKYEFVRYFEGSRYFLVLESYYEGSTYLLIDGETGEKNKIDAEPVFSPKNNRFVTVSLCDAYCTQGIKIWMRTKEGIKEEVWLHPTDFAPGESWGVATACWVDESTLRITSGNVTKIAKQVEGKTYTLRLTRDGWKIF